VRGQDARQRLGRDGEADDIVALGIELSGAQHADGLGQHDARQVARVLPRGAQLERLLVGSAGEIDLQPGPGEQHSEARPPGAGADDRDAANRRQPAQPLPLEHHARPDPIGDRGGQRLGGVLDLREAQRPTGPDSDLMRTDSPATTDRLGADQGHRHDRRTGLQRETADAAPGLAQRTGPHPGALGEDEYDVPAGEDLTGRLHHRLVAGTAVDREGAEGVEHPALPAPLKELLLGHVVHGPVGHAGDHERVQETAVVGREDHPAALGDVLAPDPLHPEVDLKERLEGHADEPVDDRVGALLPRALVKAIVIHRTVRYPLRTLPLQLRAR